MLPATIYTQAGAIAVRCENCSDDVSQWAAIVAAGLSAVALIIALLAFITARKDHAMAKKEHAKFLDDLSARAKLRIHVQLEPPHTGTTMKMGGESRVWAFLRVTLTNSEGRRTARDTVLNVVAPTWVPIRWGHQLALGLINDATSTVVRSDGPILDAEGVPHDAHQLDKQFNVSKRNAVATLVAFEVTGDHESVPFEITADSDDLPDDTPEGGIHERLVVTVVKDGTGT